jgi:hypothetical protein
MKSPIGCIEDAREYEWHEDKCGEMDAKKICFAPDNMPELRRGS